MVDRADQQRGVRLESEMALWSAGVRGPWALCRPWPTAAPRGSAGRAGANGTRCRDAQGQRGELQGNFSQGKQPVVPSRSHPAFCLFSCRRLENGRVPAALPCAVRPVRLGGPRGRPCTHPSAGLSRDCPHFQLRSWRLCPARRGAALTAGAGPRLSSRRHNLTESNS
ncbi:uncharacterized protein LOC144340338 isoform X1 [Macaca mulatta]